MTDGDLAEKRCFKFGFPSEASRDEEVKQVIRDWMWHDARVQELGRYKGFFHVIERKRLERVLERYGAV